MSPRRKNGNAQRSLVRALVIIFVGAFLLASQPRIPESFAHPIPDRESRILNLGDLLNVANRMKQLESHVVALVGDLTSPLAMVSDVAIDAGVSSEACPLGVAPSTSTAVALACAMRIAVTFLLLS